MSIAGEKLKAVVAAHCGEAFLETEVKRLLGQLNIPVPAGIFIPLGMELSPLPGLNFPIVAKVAAPAIASKTDIGGVRLGIQDSTQLAAAIADLNSIPGAAGVVVEEMASPGVEVIIGGVIDPQFGPIVMFGLGGLFVELFRDVAFALAPMDREAAARLIDGTKGARVLHGYRGKSPVDVESLISVVTTVSELIGSGLLEEIDLNPVLLYRKGCMVVDAKMKLSQGAPCIGT